MERRVEDRKEQFAIILGGEEQMERGGRGKSGSQDDAARGVTTPLQLANARNISRAVSCSGQQSPARLRTSGEEPHHLPSLCSPITTTSECSAVTIRSKAMGTADVRARHVELVVLLERAQQLWNPR